MALTIGMQISLVLSGISSGLQLAQHRYARKVNQSARMGGGGLLSEGEWWKTPSMLSQGPVLTKPHSKINN